jgi:cytosine deaminase
MADDRSTHDLVISDARLLDGRVVHLGIRDGSYATVVDAAEVSALDGAETLDAGGGLVTESFVDAHLHLEKVHTLPRLGDGALREYTSGAMDDALRSIVETASAVKAEYDRSWIEPNVRSALDQAVACGVLHVQAFVDTDTSAGLTGMESVLAVREEYRRRVDVRVVAFPQDGLLRDPGAGELCEEAMRLGADVVGGIPWVEATDRDAAQHVEWGCRLARQAGSRVAMLVDDAGDPTMRTTAMLAEGMIEHGLVGRGTACHARAVGLYAPPSVQRLAELARRAGLSFVSDPHTGPLHLPVRELLAAGLDVALGQDDIEDAYYPFGRHNMLEVAFLAAHLLGYLTAADQLALVDMVTRRAARAIGVEGHVIEVGNRANLCVHEATRVVDLLAEHARPRYVVGAGRLLATSATTTSLHD